MKYRLWDIDINRLFGTFDNEAEALGLVRTLVKSYGAAYADDLALGCEREDGTFAEPLTGAALVARAERVAATTEAVSSRSGRGVGSQVKTAGTGS